MFPRRGISSRPPPAVRGANMAGKPGAISELPTQLPARYDRGFAWKLHGSCKVARQVARDLVEQWQALGGVDGLSPQELTIVERVVFLRRRVLAYESALLFNESRRANQPEQSVPMTHGEYSNHVNVLLGLLKALGINRRQRPVKRLHEHLAAVS
jgi:hypothetical protein